MPPKLWIFQSLNEKQRSSTDLCSFLYSLYTALEDHIALREKKLLEEFGQYTLEALIIHVMGILFQHT